MTGDLLAPDDPGYFQAALTHWAEEFELTGENGRTNRYSAELKTGQKLSSFIVVDGTVEQLVDADVNNDPVVYFNHMGANSDGRDHVRLLGDNIFGYEDMVNGGDMDFDDVIVKVKLG